jgi:hypothetical protein
MESYKACSLRGVNPATLLCLYTIRSYSSHARTYKKHENVKKYCVQSIEIHLVAAALHYFLPLEVVCKNSCVSKLYCQMKFELGTKDFLW